MKRFRSLFLVAAAAAACAGPARAPETAKPFRPAAKDAGCIVDVQAGWTALDLDHALHGCSAEPLVAFVFGKVLPVDPGARPVTVRLGGQNVDGVLVPAEVLQRAIEAPPVHNVIVVFFRDGKLHGGHPSDMSATSLLEPPGPGEVDEARRDTLFAMVDWKGPEPAPEVLRRLTAAVVPAFRFVSWPLTEAADPATPAR